MILIGSKAFEVHNIQLPRSTGYTSDVDLIMDEFEFSDAIDNNFFISWQINKSKTIFAYDAMGQKYEIELLKYVPPFSNTIDSISSKSSRFLFDCKKTENSGWKCQRLWNEPSLPASRGAFAGYGGTFIKALVPPKEILFAIKKSHITFPVHWYKNIEDYHYLKHHYFNDFDLKAHKEAFKIYVWRKQEISKRFEVKINLKLKNEEFFNKYDIERIVDHDYLHRLVSVTGTPIHEKIRPDSMSAFCDEQLWKKLSFEEKLDAVREEGAVIALERIMLPHLVKSHSVDEQRAYRWAIMRICTTLTKGWFRDFAIENWPILKHPLVNLSYIAKKVLDTRHRSTV